MIFAGNYYYPSGGMYDFKGSYDTFEEAAEALRSYMYKYLGSEGMWGHIYVLKTGEIINIE